MAINVYEEGEETEVVAPNLAAMNPDIQQQIIEETEKRRRGRPSASSNIARAQTEKENKKEEETAPSSIKANKKLDRLEKIDTEKNSPEFILKSGYIPIELSSKGYLGAPKLFHIRNFDTSDLFNLSLSEQEEIPIKIIEMLDSLILEKEEVSIKNFHENEVVETLIIMFRSFFSRYIKDYPYTITDDDYKFMQNKLGGIESDEYKEFIRQVNNNVFTPKITIDLDQLTYYELTPDVKTVINVKTPTMTAKFSYPRYGDVVYVKNFLDREFKEQDKRFARLNEIMKFKMDAEERIRKGENVSFSSIPDIPEAQKKELKEYQTEKGLIMFSALKALHLIELDGKNVADLPLGERVKIVRKDARLDHTLLTQITEAFDKNLKCGVNTENLEFVNPITSGLIRGSSFRFQVFTMLTILRDTKSDNISISFE
jgi:hypothetical protein